jgi:hypothetical protein
VSNLYLSYSVSDPLYAKTMRLQNEHLCKGHRLRVSKKPDYARILCDTSFFTTSAIAHYVFFFGNSHQIRRRWISRTFTLLCKYDFLLVAEAQQQNFDAGDLCSGMARAETATLRSKQKTHSHTPAILALSISSHEILTSALLRSPTITTSTH